MMTKTYVPIWDLPMSSTGAELINPATGTSVSYDGGVGEIVMDADATNTPYGELPLPDGDPAVGKRLAVEAMLGVSGSGAPAILKVMQNDGTSDIELGQTTVTLSESVTLDVTCVSNNEPYVVISQGDVGASLRIPLLGYKEIDDVVHDVVMMECNDDEFGTDYRFGFNGMTKDNNLKGIGNSLDFGARIHDSRLGRWLSIDAMASKPHNVAFSPYSFVRNNPIIFIDPDGNDWVLSTGNKIYWYGGQMGDKKNLLATFKASSGSFFVWNGHVEHDYRNSKYQAERNLGPTPEGQYSINLKPDPGRVAKIDFTSPVGSIRRGDLLRNPDGGIEKIPETTQDPSGMNLWWNYSNWGTKRARLEPVKVTGASSSQRDNGSYYIHDSQKGGTHGCTECESTFFDKLESYREDGNEKIDVIVDYPSNDYNTNGGTNKTNLPVEGERTPINDD